jgi:hypothetical protein
MNPLLLRLLGVRAGDAGTVVSASLEIHPALSWMGLVLIATAALAIAVLSYRRRDVEITRGRRRVLLALRALALAGVLGVLLRPALSLGIEGLVREVLVLLFDQSASLALRDPRLDRADQVRVAIAHGELNGAAGLNQTLPGGIDLQPTRLELLGAILTNRELALIENLERNFDLKAAGFASELLSLRTVAPAVTNASPARQFTGPVLASALRATGRETAIGTAVRQVLDRERERRLGGVVLFTDGIHNAGVDPREAAAVARDAGVALHVVALGTTAPRDIQLVDVTAPEVAFVRDEVPITARLRARGFASNSIRVTLGLGDAVIEERDVTLEPDRDATIELGLTPEKTGDFVLKVEAAPQPDEILVENNRQSRRLRVIDDRIRVLLLEESPRWEFRYLQALLLRDRRVDLKCVLFDGDPAIARGAGSPYLEGFPTRREELFAFDLIVFGDVDPRHFTPSQLEFLADFVARSGGSFLMLAGRRFSPWSYRDTPIERMLPVEFDRVPTEGAAQAVHDQPLKLALTEEGRASSMLRMAEDPEENHRRWERLPPLYWVAPVDSAKPAARVLVTDETRQGTDPIPVIAVQQYGVGQSMFVGTDNTWRWRRNEGEKFWISFWGRVVQRLAIHHLISGSRQTQLALDRVSAVPGERVGISARLFTSAFEPVSEPTVAAVLEREGDEQEGWILQSELMLRAVPDQPGLFHAELVAPAPGRYRLRVGHDAPASVDFMVEDRLVESGESAMQEALLREIAAQTGGGFFREEDLHTLPDVARGKARRVLSRQNVELWSSPLYFLMVLFLFGTEWALRKWWQLK